MGKHVQSRMLAEDFSCIQPFNCWQMFGLLPACEPSKGVKVVHIYQELAAHRCVMSAASATRSGTAVKEQQ